MFLFIEVFRGPQHRVLDLVIPRIFGHDEIEPVDVTDPGGDHPVTFLFGHSPNPSNVYTLQQVPILAPIGAL